MLPLLFPLPPISWLTTKGPSPKPGSTATARRCFAWHNYSIETRGTTREISTSCTLATFYPRLYHYPCTWAVKLSRPRPVLLVDRMRRKMLGGWGGNRMIFTSPSSSEPPLPQVCANFQSNYIDSTVVPRLVLSDWQTLVPLIGPRIVLMEVCAFGNDRVVSVPAADV